MIDDSERSGLFEDAIRVALRGWQSGIWTAMPGTLFNFDPVKQTASFLIGVQAQITDPNGVKSWVDIPNLVDCPVQFPRGGQAVMTFPVNDGDEGLVVFSSRCMDAWYQQGGTQPQAEFRMHDLSDGFIIPGVSSQINAIHTFNATAAEIRSLDGATKIALDPTAQTVAITAPHGATINANTTINGNLHVTGTITGDTDVVTGSISLKNHKHGGVTAGAAQTGVPV